jgi:formyl-CoA transferase
VNVPDNIIWERLCKVIGREDLIEDDRTINGPQRAKNDSLIREAMEIWLSDKERDSVVNLLNESGVPAGPVQTASDIFEDPQVKARKMLVDIVDPDYGTHTFARTPMRLSEVDEIDKIPAPRLGEHTVELLREIIGMEEKEIEKLMEEGIISG